MTPLVARATDRPPRPLIHCYPGNLITPEATMSDPLNPDTNLSLQDQMIDQLTIIRGCVQLVLLRYPGDPFLRETLGKVTSATELLLELSRKQETV